MRYLTLSLIAFTPLAASAAQITDFASLVSELIGIINYVIAFVIALSFLTIVWGVVKAWIIGGGNEESVKSGKMTILVGFIVFTLMIGVWGILAILKQTFFA